MKIHADNLTLAHIREAARQARVEVLFLEPVGSRKRRYGFNVYLSGSSPYATQFDRESKAATWDEWGVFLAYLLDIDCRAIAGQYNGRADFFAQTREHVEATRRYERIVGRKHKGVTGPWLSPRAGESQESFDAATKAA